MDEFGIPKNKVLEILKTNKAKDLRYQDGRILGSMCTSPHEFAKEVHAMFIETNLGDSGLFPGTKQLEDEVISSISRLQGLEGVSGLLVTGGTEANILALWAARNMKRKKKVIMPETAHFSFDKACNLLGLEIIRAGVDQDKRVDVSSVESKVDKDTCAIIGVAGTTEYGTVDDLKGLSELASEKELYFHIDAAFGGFVLPFLDELGYKTGFELPKRGLDSITVDPHKMGLVPIPLGCILFKEKEYMEILETQAPYLTKKRQHTIVGTRTGASAASAFAIFKLLGRNGYKEIVKMCMENTMRLYEGILGLGFSVRKPTINILAFKADASIHDGLSKRGWRLSRTREGEIRIVVMPHVSKTVVEEFLSDLRIFSGEGDA